MSITQLENLLSVFNETSDGNVKRYSRLAAQNVFTQLFPAESNGLGSIPYYAEFKKSKWDHRNLSHYFTTEELETYWDPQRECPQKIGLIKLIRTRLNLSLKEAKEYVEQHMEGKPPYYER